MNESIINSKERMITDSLYSKILTNINCWTQDSRKIVYDVRSAKNGDVFDGKRIEAIDINTRKVENLYESQDTACCGVATCSPVDGRIVFIHGPENPDDFWNYSFQHRRGVIRYADGRTKTMDACNIVPPLAPGALRGGSHVHVFSGDGQLVSFTYNDHILNVLDERNKDISNLQEHDIDQRNVGVAVPLRAVTVNRLHARHHDGTHFSVLVTQTVNQPKPGSDEISKAYEEGWIGKSGYQKPDGTIQKYALAFLGDVVLNNGQNAAEIFSIDLPDEIADFAVPGDGPLEGTTTRRPFPPKGVVQQRLTRTANRKYPGIQGARHWLRSSPDGSKIAFLMKDDNGIVQLWTISPNGGEPKPWTSGKNNVASAFTWSPDGLSIAYVMDRSLFASSESQTIRLTPKTEDSSAPLPHAVVFSPNGKHIAFMRNICFAKEEYFNQIFVLDV